MSDDNSHRFNIRMAGLIGVLGAGASILSLSLDHTGVAIALLVVAACALCVLCRQAVIDMIKRIFTRSDPKDAVKAVFLYGSLLDLKDLEQTIGRRVYRRNYKAAVLPGYDKQWGVASTRLNMVKPDWHSAHHERFLWLTIKERPGATCSGAVVHVTNGEFAAICSRERSYRPVVVTIENPDGQDWRDPRPVVAFVGLPHYAKLEGALVREGYLKKLDKAYRLHQLEPQLPQLPSGQANAIPCFDADKAFSDRWPDRPANARALRKCLLDRGRTRGLDHNGDPKVIPTLARPMIFSGILYGRVCHAAEQAVRLVSQTLDYVLEDPERAEKDFSFTRDEIEYARIEKDVPGAHIPQIARVDFTVSRDTVKILEVNCDSPAGMAHLDDLVDWYSARAHCAIGGDCKLDFPRRRNAICRALMKAFLDRFESSSGSSGRPAGIAIVERDPEHRPAYTEFTQFSELMMTELEIPAVVCEPKDLRFIEGRLVHSSEAVGETHVELIYKRILWEDLLDVGPEADGMLEAYKDRKVCICNSLRSRLAGNKRFFPLYDGNDRPFWSEQENHPTWKNLDHDMLLAHLPATKLLTEELRNHVEQNPHKYTIKPCRSFMGQGVCCGPHEQDMWAEHVRNAIHVGDHVFQEYCHHGYVSTRLLEPVAGTSGDVLWNWPFIVGAYVVNGECVGLEAKAGPRLPVALREQQGGHRTAILTPGPIVRPSPIVTQRASAGLTTKQQT